MKRSSAEVSLNWAIIVIHWAETKTIAARFVSKDNLNMICMTVTKLPFTSLRSVVTCSSSAKLFAVFCVTFKFPFDFAALALLVPDVQVVSIFPKIAHAHRLYLSLS